MSKLQKSKKFNTDQSSVIRTYMSEIDSGPLLTKDQERVLLRDIEVYQKQILTEIIKSPYARYELQMFLITLDTTSESIVDLSKHLNEESPADLIESVKLKFTQLIESLSSFNIDETTQLLNEVALVGNHVFSIVTELKKKQSIVLDIRSKQKEVLKYFPNDTAYDLIVALIKEQPLEVFASLKTRWQLTDLKTTNLINDLTMHINECNNLLRHIPATFEAYDITEINNKISNLEFQARRYKDELILKNLRLVVSRANKFLDKGLDLEDLIQEGNIGLIKAIDKFDSSRDTKISTYATWWIDQTIRRAISNKGKTIRIPTHIEWKQTSLNNLTQKMTKLLKREPTLAELAQASGEKLSFLQELKGWRPNHEVALEAELPGGLSVLDTLAADESYNPHEIFESKALYEHLRSCLEILSPRDQMIVRLRFGLGELSVDDEGDTLQVIADQFNITKAGAGVVVNNAIRKMHIKSKNWNK